MKCPKCGNRADVIRTRYADGRVVRRRKCRGCGFRVTTAEVPLASISRSRTRADLAAALRRTRAELDRVAELTGTAELERLAS